MIFRSDQIKHKFKNVIELINSEGGIVMYLPGQRRFQIIMADKKIIYKTYNEIEEQELRLREKPGRLKGIKRIISKSIDII